MLQRPLAEVCELPAAARPAVLEGRWLGEDGERTWAAVNPLSILEGAREALEELPTWLAWHTRRFPTGAAIGFFAYELARFFEALPLPRRASLPDVSFAYYPRITELSLPDAAPDRIAPARPAELRANFDRTSYRVALEKIRDYIAAGDIYQANLTLQFSAPLQRQLPEEIYTRLRTGGAPFRAFLKAPGRAILSSSPERFFRVCDRHILASPIKGTIARAGVEDEEAKSKLLASAKDRAENVMIVDLLRNDLGRICRFDTIQARLCATESLPHLVHLVSHVEGTLRPEAGILEILRALFPCGSITGAPKIRAMEILSEIEGVPRGVSMGALGIIRGLPGSEHCTMDFNVAIRTLLIEDGVAVFNVGGGIVYDSRPEAEYEEAMLKARPLLEALDMENFRNADSLLEDHSISWTT